MKHIDEITLKHEIEKKWIKGYVAGCIATSLTIGGIGYFKENYQMLETGGLVSIASSILCPIIMNEKEYKRYDKEIEKCRGEDK